MCELVKPKKLTFEKEIGLSSKPQIKPLLLGKIERPKNLQIDIMQYEFSKPYVPPVQIKTEYQNAEEVKTDCVSDEEVAAELGPGYDPPCSQLTYEADIRISKSEFSNVKRKKLFEVCLEYVGYINLFYIMLFNIYFIDSASAYDRDMHAHAFLAICNSDQSRKKTSLTDNVENIKPDVDWTDDKDWKLSRSIIFMLILISV